MPGARVTLLTEQDVRGRLPGQPARAEQDVQALAAMRARRSRELYAPHVTAEQLERAVRDFCSPAYLRSLTSRRSVLVARDPDGQACGIAAFTVDGGIVTISDMYAARDGEGIGGALLECIWRFAEIDDATVARVEVFEFSQAARSFWAHQRFHDAGASRVSVAYPPHRLLEMRRELP